MADDARPVGGHRSDTNAALLDTLFLYGGNAVYVVVFERNIGSKLGCSAVAGRDEQPFQPGALTDFPGQGVFASPGAYDENIQEVLLCCKRDGSTRPRSGA